MNANAAAAANIGGMPRFSNTNSGGRMTASFGARNASGAASASSNSGTGAGVVAATAGFLSGWGGILLILLALVILFAIYYQTIGYYIQIGWEKLKWSHDRGEKIEIDVPGPISAELSPAPAGGAVGGAGASISASLSGAINRLESDVEAALGGPESKQVFNISRNLYTFAEAEPVCRAFGAELATYDQVKEAYEKGADWCNYGWVKGQLAIYPTQQETFDKLQHGPEDQRMSCGVPGVNGGYFPNAEQRFGVNCYGPRPAESALDERTQMQSQNTTEFDREVNHFRAIRDSIAVSPWNDKQWSS
jgi:Extracellular link domain